MDINFNTIILEDLITGYLFSNYVELFLMNNTCRNIKVIQYVKYKIV